MSKASEDAIASAKRAGWSPDGGIYMEGFEAGARALLEYARNISFASDGSEFPRLLVDISDLEAYFAEAKEEGE